jgi:hypothetical protein
VTIESIGARGDGVARLGTARIFVPGDRLCVRIIDRRGDDLVGEPVQWVRQASRAEPPCPHFGACAERAQLGLLRADRADHPLALGERRIAGFDVDGDEPHGAASGRSVEQPADQRPVALLFEREGRLGQN